MKMIYISALTCAQMLPRLSSHRSSSEEACLNSRMPSEMRLSRKGIKQLKRAITINAAISPVWSIEAVSLSSAIIVAAIYE